MAEFVKETPALPDAEDAVHVTHESYDERGTVHIARSVFERFPSTHEASGPTVCSS
jgi:hypothetical protein